LRRLVAHDPLVVAGSVVLTGTITRAAVVFVEVVFHAEIMTKLMGKEDRVACVIFSPLPHLCDKT